MWFLYPSRDGALIKGLTLTCRRRSDACSANVTVDEWGFTLERFALHSVENCASDANRYAWHFDSDIQLDLRQEISGFGRSASSGGRPFHVAKMSYLLSRLLPRRARHRPAQSGERVAQGDVGVGPWRHRPAAQRNRRQRAAARRLRSCASPSTTGKLARASPPATWRRTKSATCTPCIASGSIEASGHYSQL